MLGQTRSKRQLHVKLRESSNSTMSMAENDQDAQAEHALSLWKEGVDRSSAIDSMPRSGCGRPEWSCLLGSSTERGPALRRTRVGPQLASTLCGPDVDLSDLAGHMGAACGGSACMLVLDDELVLLFAYDMDDGNNELLMLSCERVRIEGAVRAFDEDEHEFGWLEPDEYSTFPMKARSIGFGTGCAELLIGAALCFLEDFFATHDVLAVSPVLAVDEYSPEEDVCLAPPGFGFGPTYSSDDVATLVLQSELDARKEAPGEEELRACLFYNNLLFDAFKNMEDDYDVFLDDLLAPGTVRRRRTRYPVVLFRELVQRERASLDESSCSSFDRFVFSDCPSCIFETVVSFI
jgi:hypothetical protein